MTDGTRQYRGVRRSYGAYLATAHSDSRDAMDMHPICVQPAVGHATLWLQAFRIQCGFGDHYTRFIVAETE